MRKPRTHVLVVADKSCSMLGVAKGVRVGINAYVADLCDDAERDYRLTLVTFAQDYVPICVAVPPAQVPKLTCDNYVPDGNTALLDAIGQTFADFDAAVPELADGDRVLFVLATDGADNWSLHFTPKDILAEVRKREAGPWTFIHLAAGVDAVHASPSLGLRHVIAIAWADLDRRATYDGMGLATRAFAAGDSTADITKLLDETLTGAQQ